MTIRWRREGLGFSQRERPVLPASPSAADMRELLETVHVGGSFEGWIAAVEHNARALVSDADEAERERIGLVLRLIAVTRHEIESGQAERSARYAVELGYLIRELELSDFERAADTGLRVIDAGARGGRKAGLTAQRDRQLAEEYQAKKAAGRSSMSDTAYMIAVGKAHGLKRTAAIEAIGRGLKNLSGKPAKPDE